MGGEVVCKMLDEVGEEERWEAETFQKSLFDLDRTTLRTTFTGVVSKSGPMTAVERLVVPALAAIGLGWERGELSLAQVYMSGRICEQLVATVLPDIGPDETAAVALVVLDDYHLLGKRIVSSVLRASGHRFLDYGRQHDIDQLVNRVRCDGVRLLLISTLMLRAALRVSEVVSALRAAELEVDVVVGGAPFRLDPSLWREVGATDWGANASDAPELVERLLGARR